MTSRGIVVNITSDILCPWCWVGKRSLDEAVRTGKNEVTVRWHPYFLHKDVPEEGVDKLKHYKKRFGKANALKLLTDKDSEVQVAGRDLGLEFNWSKGTILSNAMKGHRLLWYVMDTHGPASQHNLMDAMFYRYFTLNHDIGSDEVLLDAARSVGLPCDEISAFLSTNSYLAEVNDFAAKNNTNVKTIPHFEFSREGEETPFEICGGKTIDGFSKVINT
eukprot:TRINITY_DN21954_c0_g1_i1.p1 TRINITY_DN21954_c0_g1~~TRINITY_DN21954_c0_g1_i1.p1  ORF type:complete len:219 (+),score=36.71 TRINITY_DN21954_c0_g1_i1:48-704(+)